ncbi:MAG: DUF1552 domain-containing protein [Opitutaceae bacterium]|nr:DUF1552 domain-containing protein [Opitutaceae bacterium]
MKNLPVKKNLLTTLLWSLLPVTLHAVAPLIGDVPDQVIAQNTNTGALFFTLGDNETTFSALNVSATSSNPTLVPNTAQPPLDPADPREYLEKVRLMYDMARLAFETDSTRAVTLMLDSVNSPVIDVAGTPISDGYHNLSHHGKSEGKLKQLEAIDRAHLKLLDRLFADLKARPEGDETLLDRTMVLYGSNLGNANTHVTTNLPVILAGGGFRHGQHLAFDRERNYPLPNLYVSMLQRMGLEADKFATSTGTTRGLDSI